MKVFFNHVSMKLIPLAIVIIIVLALFSCSNSAKSLNENKIFHIDIDKCELSIDLKLSDLTDSCRLVRLETTKECVLGPYLSYLYISDKYIIIDDRYLADYFLEFCKWVLCKVIACCYLT